MSIAKPWRATSVQMYSELAALAPNTAAAWEVIGRNLDRAVTLIEQTQAGSTPAALFVTPEFAFQGPPQGMASSAWIRHACCECPGPITRPLADLARRLGIFIGGNQFECDPAWPGRYFNTCFLIDPQGELILRYRRVTTEAFPSPHDFLADYCAAYPPEQRFPVVDTALGRMAMIPCSEISVPEVARVMMMQGAEVILHPTNSRRLHAEDAAKIARCAENKCYLISANVAGPIGFSPDRSILGGRSRIIDYSGALLAMDHDDGASQHCQVSAMIDVEALRRDRMNDQGPSGLLRARWELYRPFFNSATFYPADSFASTPMQHHAECRPAIEQARKNLLAAGFIAPQGESTN